MRMLHACGAVEPLEREHFDKPDRHHATSPHQPYITQHTITPPQPIPHLPPWLLSPPPLPPPPRSRSRCPPRCRPRAAASPCAAPCAPSSVRDAPPLTGLVGWLVGWLVGLLVCWLVVFQFSCEVLGCRCVTLNEMVLWMWMLHTSSRFKRSRRPKAHTPITNPTTPPTVLLGPLPALLLPLPRPLIPIPAPQQPEGLSSFPQSGQHGAADGVGVLPGGVLAWFWGALLAHWGCVEGALGVH